MLVLGYYVVLISWPYVVLSSETCIISSQMILINGTLWDGSQLEMDLCCIKSETYVVLSSKACVVSRPHDLCCIKSRGYTMWCMASHGHQVLQLSFRD